MNILLMGMRGVGKSTVGPVLANCLHPSNAMRFVDLDTLTPSVLGCSNVIEAWNKHGEAAFRDAEFAALSQCLHQDHQVIALGGGAPTAPGVFSLLIDQQHAGRVRVVYLRGSARTIQDRLRRDPNISQRPSLTGGDPVAEAPIVLQQREPIYIKLADVIVSVEGRSPEELAQEIRRRLQA